MTTQESEEQITLSSAAFDQFKDDDTPKTVTNELSQSIQIKEQLKLFRIFDKKYINVNEKTADGTISFFFKLAMLDPTPARKRKIKFLHLLSGCILLAAAWFTFTLKQAGHPLLTSVYVYTAVAVLVALGLILIVYVFKEFSNVLVFYSLHGRIPIAELLYHIPNKREFNQFVSELIENIKNSKSHVYYSESQLLAAELTEHRKLRDESIISNKIYELAKNNIMKYH